MLPPSSKRNIYRIIPFAVFWFFFSIVYSLLERGLLGHLTKYPSTGNPYNFTKTVFTTPIIAFILGLLLGSAEVLYLNKMFSQKSFIKKIVFKTVFYLSVIILFLSIITIVYNAVEIKKGIFDETVWNYFSAFFFNYAFWSVVLYIASIIGVSLFYNEVSEHLGQGVVNNFFTGKYHTPKAEERIFMFLDMKGSTTIAESMGHVAYFKMLKQYYADLSYPIVKYAGEIYQYVGDEVVVSWKLKNGLHNNNCIKCFLAMKTSIKRQEKKYKEQFGLLPVFKAGFHLGNVTTGEIGVIKKEIIFTGDVLNTTARIQSLCNAYNVDILLSGQLIGQLPAKHKFTIKPLGETELRGREEKIALFTIEVS